MAEPKKKCYGQEKKKMAIKMDKVGSGSVGAAILLLASAALASSIFVREKGWSSGESRRHRHQNAPPAAVNRMKNKNEQDEASKGLQLVLLDTPSSHVQNHFSGATKLVYPQILALDKKAGIEVKDGSGTPGAVSDGETNEQILCSIGPENLENDAVADRTVINREGFETKNTVQEQLATEHKQHDLPDEEFVMEKCEEMFPLPMSKKEIACEDIEVTKDEENEQVVDSLELKENMPIAQFVVCEPKGHEHHIEENMVTEVIEESFGTIDTDTTITRDDLTVESSEDEDADEDNSYDHDNGTVKLKLINQELEGKMLADNAQFTDGKCSSKRQLRNSIQQIRPNGNQMESANVGTLHNFSVLMLVVLWFILAGSWSHCVLHHGTVKST
ncbi:hypothetical protein CDL12_18664 [Handroanthus impetiginosus]|uniref:Uncharacterized protein n=1 Tax=Handroanthus impetiginosus TaxID=429701 RepID=A0A2G9GU04_9LAMI|nr:hypothetical protein CDL12_18664 [Handroanthus impetiginosus]